MVLKVLQGTPPSSVYLSRHWGLSSDKQHKVFSLHFAYYKGSKFNDGKTREQGNGNWHLAYFQWKQTLLKPCRATLTYPPQTSLLTYLWVSSPQSCGSSGWGRGWGGKDWRGREDEVIKCCVEVAKVDTHTHTIVYKATTQYGTCSIRNIFVFFLQGYCTLQKLLNFTLATTLFIQWHHLQPHPYNLFGNVASLVKLLDGDKWPNMAT